MDRTLDDVSRRWDWKGTWGWDYPSMAMTAARLGRGEDAVSALLMDTPKNHYSPNGHVYQRANLPLYLPANGGLLAACGDDGRRLGRCAAEPAPGFPAGGQWTVRVEKLQRMP